MAKLLSGTRIYGNVTVDTFVTATGNVVGGNVLTGGLISATGNITGGNVLGGANVNATTHTGTTVSVSANVTGGNILTGGIVSATGNITGSYFIGNGSQLTGLSTGGGNLWVVGRSATYYVPIVSGILTVVSRTGNISVPINS